MNTKYVFLFHTHTRDKPKRNSYSSRNTEALSLRQYRISWSPWCFGVSHAIHSNWNHIFFTSLRRTSLRITSVCLVFQWKLVCLRESDTNKCTKAPRTACGVLSLSSTTIVPSSWTSHQEDHIKCSRKTPYNAQQESPSRYRGKEE